MREQHTVLLKTKSWFPSCVKNFIAQPRGSLTVSAEPRSGPTVEIRSITGVVVPMPLRKLADVISEMSWVTSNVPKAPAALACTTLPSEASQASLADILCHKSGGEIPFRYSLSGEMGQCLNELRVLEKKQATSISPQLQR